MPQYKEDRAWADQFMLSIRQTMGVFAFQVAPDDIDKTFGADLLSFRSILTASHILARVRNWEAYEADKRRKYLRQFTIRYERDSGTETEYAKIMKGAGDYLFYAWGSRGKGTPDLHAAFLLNLETFRRQQQHVKQGVIANGDGTHFKWYDIDERLQIRALYSDIYLAQISSEKVIS